MALCHYILFFLEKSLLFLKNELTKANLLSIIYTCDSENLYDPLAQLAEHLTFNQGVRSSNLRWVTKTKSVYFNKMKYTLFVLKVSL